VFFRILVIKHGVLKCHALFAELKIQFINDAIFHSLLLSLNLCVNYVHVVFVSHYFGKMNKILV
jgi:hypothetical protein